MSRAPLLQPRQIHLFIAYDNFSFFKPLVPLLNVECIRILGKADTVTQAIEWCNPFDIDVLVMDMAFGARLVQEFQAKRPLLKIIGMTKEFEKPAIQTMRNLKMRGSIFEKPLDIERTIDCIQAVARGELYFRFIPIK